METTEATGESMMPYRKETEHGWIQMPTLWTCIPHRLQLLYKAQNRVWAAADAIIIKNMIKNDNLYSWYFQIFVYLLKLLLF